MLDARNEAMLVALRRLCRKDRHNTPISSWEIARACDFDHQTILNIERSALRKMRHRLSPDVRAAFDALIARDRETAKPKKTRCLSA